MRIAGHLCSSIVVCIGFIAFCNLAIVGGLRTAGERCHHSPNLNMLRATTGNLVRRSTPGLIARKYFSSLLRSAAYIGCDPMSKELMLNTASKLQKPKIIFVLGGPGAGKGTQCELLSKEFGIQHLSAGELLRAERLTGSADGQLIESYLKEGNIVPVEISLSLLRREILNTNQQRYLIDGFPRNHDNLQGWMHMMPEICDVESIIFIDCPEEQLEQRILSRGLTSNRSDDNISTIKKRFATYHRETLPVIDYFRVSHSANYDFQSISGERRKEEVYASFKGIFQSFVMKELDFLHTLLVYCQQCQADCSLQTIQEVMKRFEISEELLRKEQQILAATGLTCPPSAADVVLPPVSLSGALHRAEQSYALPVGEGQRRVRRVWELVGGGWKLRDIEEIKIAQ